MEEQPLFDIEKMKKVFKETNYYNETENITTENIYPIFDIERIKRNLEGRKNYIYYYKEKEMPKTLFNIPSNNELPDSFKKYFDSYTKNAITRGKMEIF